VAIRRTDLGAVPVTGGMVQAWYGISTIVSS
jgi:hypothetical protein